MFKYLQILQITMAESKRIYGKKSTEDENKPHRANAIGGLVINVLFWPGLGTIIGGETKIGVWQMVLFAIGAILSFILIGIPLAIGIWIWALVSSINQIKASEE